MSLVFLIWSVAFFLIPEFRQALRMPILGWSLSHTFRWLERAGTLPPELLERYARTAEQQRDAPTLAFAALHSPNGQQRNRWAEEAVNLDKRLRWVYDSLFFEAQRLGAYNPQLDSLVKQLEAWDADNAFPYLLEASQIADRQGSRFPGPQQIDALAGETEWRQAMDKAFTAPRYTAYQRERFDLERTWLRANHLDDPPIVLLSVAGYPIPRLYLIRMYSDLLVKKFGNDAEQAGHLPEAAGYYWKVAHMGERMQLQGGSTIEKLIGAALQMTAYSRLAPLLARMGLKDEAATVKYALQELDYDQDIRTGKDPLAQSSNYNWSVLTVHIFAGMVVVFGLVTAMALLYVNAKRWVRRDTKGRLYAWMTISENYAPVLLFGACVGLFYTYYPFSQNFEHYMQAKGFIHEFEPLFYNAMPAPDLMAGRVVLPLGNPFVPYVWYALAGLVVIVCWALVERGKA